MNLLLKITLFALLSLLVEDAVGFERFDTGGGLGRYHTPGRRFKKMVRKLKADAELKYSETYQMFKAELLRVQEGAGGMYYVKVKTGKRQYIHLRIYKPPGAYPELVSIKRGVTQHAKIQLFE